MSDTSPLLNLAIIGQLHLVRQQFGEVVIPPAVADELKVDSDLPGSASLRQAISDGWLRVVPLQDQLLATALLQELNAGEAEAIALAAVLRAEHLLIDESDGRAVATRLGIRSVGAAGVLLRAKRDGSLASIAAELQRLIDHAGFYLSPELVKRIIEEAGEAPAAEA